MAKASDHPSEARHKIARAVAALEREFGIPEWESREPIAELVVTILSQNTSDGNRDNAYRRLRGRFPDWRVVMNADAAEIEAAIRPAGLGPSKSVRIKAVLGWIDQTFGGLTLQPLAAMSDDQAIELLTSQKGIGVKTAAVLLAFSFGRDLCPVDTHVQRIAGRQGWISAAASAMKTFYALRPLIPAGKGLGFHLNILKFGRSRCTARRPACPGCPLGDDCIWEGKGTVSAAI